jgi:hypothetical protein
VALREVARPIVALGGGAMVLAPQIVLYYDDSPEGPQEAELLDTGLGLLPHATFFPHARVRLDLDNVARVATLARRFGPDPCVALENGAWLERRRTGWRSRGRPGTAFELRPTGELVGLPEVKP